MQNRSGQEQRTEKCRGGVEGRSIEQEERAGREGRSREQEGAGAEER